MKRTRSDGMNIYVGSSLETKPTSAESLDPTFFFEYDTGDLYYFDDETEDWVAVGGESA